MDRNLFEQLAESMEQMGEITRGERAPSRRFHVDAIKVKEVRAATGLSQARFAKVIDVSEKGARGNIRLSRLRPLLCLLHHKPRFGGVCAFRRPGRRSCGKASSYAA